MAGTARRLLIWAVIAALVWMAGDRYGVPGIAQPSIDKSFGAIEATTAKGWNMAFGPQGRISGFLAGDRLTKTANEASSSPAIEPITVTRVSTASNPAGGLAGNSALRTNDIAVGIIKRSEALRLEAYEEGGKMRIGYGHTMKPGEPTRITAAEAERLLREDLGITEDAIKRMLTREASENQFSAMVSLAYTTGYGTFGRSSILSKFNDGDVEGSADAFLLYVKGGGKVLPHLEHRRAEERALFLKS